MNEQTEEIFKDPSGLTVSKKDIKLARKLYEIWVEEKTDKQLNNISFAQYLKTVYFNVDQETNPKLKPPSKFVNGHTFPYNFVGYNAPFADLMYHHVQFTIDLLLAIVEDNETNQNLAVQGLIENKENWVSLMKEYHVPQDMVNKWYQSGTQNEGLGTGIFLDHSLAVKTVFENVWLDGTEIRLSGFGEESLKILYASNLGKVVSFWEKAAKVNKEVLTESWKGHIDCTVEYAKQLLVAGKEGDSFISASEKCLDQGYHLGLIFDEAFSPIWPTIFSNNISGSCKNTCFDKRTSSINSTQIPAIESIHMLESKQIPVIESKQIPVIESKQIPVIESKSKRNYVIESKRIPGIHMIESKRNCVIESKQIPVIESKSKRNYVIESKRIPGIHMIESKRNPVIKSKSKRICVFESKRIPSLESKQIPILETKRTDILIKNEKQKILTKPKRFELSFLDQIAMDEDFYSPVSCHNDKENEKKKIAKKVHKSSIFSSEKKGIREKASLLFSISQISKYISENQEFVETLQSPTELQSLIEELDKIVTSLEKYNNVVHLREKKNAYSIINYEKLANMKQNDIIGFVVAVKCLPTALDCKQEFIENALVQLSFLDIFRGLPGALHSYLLDFAKRTPDDDWPRLYKLVESDVRELTTEIILSIRTTKNLDFKIGALALICRIFLEELQNATMKLGSQAKNQYTILMDLFELNFSQFYYFWHDHHVLLLIHLPYSISPILYGLSF